MAQVRGPILARARQGTLILRSFFNHGLCKWVKSKPPLWIWALMCRNEILSAIWKKTEKEIVINTEKEKECPTYAIHEPLATATPLPPELPPLTNQSESATDSWTSPSELYSPPAVWERRFCTLWKGYLHILRVGPNKLSVVPLLQNHSRRRSERLSVIFN